jgi:hypothetical protein
MLHATLKSSATVGSDSIFANFYLWLTRTQDRATVQCLALAVFWHLVSHLVRMSTFLILQPQSHFFWFLGARSNVSQTTTEEYSQERPGLSCITTSTTVTFVFEDDIPDTLCTGATFDPDAAYIADSATEALAAASPPPSPTSSIISIECNIDSDNYLRTSDAAFNSSDVTGLQPNSSDDRLILVPPTQTRSSTPTSIDGDGDLNPSSTLSAAITTSLAPATIASSTPTSIDACGNPISSLSIPLAPSTSTGMPTQLQTPAHNRWYVVTVGTNVGVFHGWYVLRLDSAFCASWFSRNAISEYVVGVPGSCYVYVGTKADAHATFEASLAAGKVSVVS